MTCSVGLGVCGMVVVSVSQLQVHHVITQKDVTYVL